MIAAESGISIPGLHMYGYDVSRTNERPCHSSRLLTYIQADTTIILQASSKEILDALFCSHFLILGLYKS
jgi:hypothetical protein